MENKIEQFTDLEICDNNLMVIYDQRAGRRFGLIYIDPQTSDYVQFKSNLAKLIFDKKSNEDLYEFQIKYAFKFLVGIREGELGYKGKPISTNPESEIYFKEWKELLHKKLFNVCVRFAETLLGDTSAFVVKENNLPFSES